MASTWANLTPKRGPRIDQNRLKSELGGPQDARPLQGYPCIDLLMILIKNSMKNPCHVGMDFSSIKKKSSGHQSPGRPKNIKQRLAPVSPKQRGARKSKVYHSTSDQGPGVKDQPGIIPNRFDQDRSRSGQFCGSNQAKVAKHVAEPSWAPEKRSRGIRWGNRHGFLRSIWSQPPRLKKCGKKAAFPLRPIP